MKSGTAVIIAIGLIIVAGAYLYFQDNNQNPFQAPYSPPKASFQTEFSQLKAVFSSEGVNIQPFYTNDAKKIFEKDNSNLEAMRTRVTQLQNGFTIDSSKKAAEIYGAYLDYAIAQKKVNEKAPSLAQFAINDNCTSIEKQKEIHNMRAPALDALLTYFKGTVEFVMTYKNENEIAQISIPPLDMKKMMEDYSTEAISLETIITSCTGANA